MSIAELIQLEMTPRISDYHLARALMLSVDLAAQVIHFALGVGHVLELLYGADDVFTLNALAVVIELAPPENPDIWAFRTMNTSD
jgi:hypothetical protein